MTAYKKTIATMVLASMLVGTVAYAEENFSGRTLNGFFREHGIPKRHPIVHKAAKTLGLKRLARATAGPVPGVHYGRKLQETTYEAAMAEGDAHRLIPTDWRLYADHNEGATATMIHERALALGFDDIAEKTAALAAAEASDPFDPDHGRKLQQLHANPLEIPVPGKATKKVTASPATAAATSAFVGKPETKVSKPVIEEAQPAVVAAAKEAKVAEDLEILLKEVESEKRRLELELVEKTQHFETALFDAERLVMAIKEEAWRVVKERDALAEKLLRVQELESAPTKTLQDIVGALEEENKELWAENEALRTVLNEKRGRPQELVEEHLGVTEPLKNDLVKAVAEEVAHENVEKILKHEASLGK